MGAHRAPRRRLVRRVVAPAAALLLTASLTQPLSWAAVDKHLDRNRPQPDLGKSVLGSAAQPSAPAATPVSSQTAPLPSATLPAAGRWTIALGSGRVTSLLTRALPGGGPGGRVASAWTQLGRSGIDVAGAVSAGAASASGPVVRSVGAEVVTPAVSRAAGLSGIVLRLARQDGVTAAAPVAVSIPDRLLDGLYGADYASRVHWVQLPAANPASAAAQAAARPVASTSSDGATVLTPEVGNNAVLLAAAGAPGGATGSFSATSLKPSSSWQVSAQTGGFGWSYPLPTPPPAAGPTPGLGLGYNSQGVDGETGSTNNQPDEIGDGWSLAGLGYVERGYLPCAQDDGPTGRVTGKYDECWSNDNATLLMGGHSGRLIKVNATTWRLQNDDGTRIEHLTGNGCGNATYDNDCWRVTTLDGTQYWFGRNELPGWASGKATTNSAWTVPVFGNDPGEPGYNGDGTHAGTFASEVKTQAWRWNLDYVVDPNNNSEAYYYKTESNDYRENNATVVSYIRGGYLDHIDYGMRAEQRIRNQRGVGQGGLRSGRLRPLQRFHCSRDQLHEGVSDRGEARQDDRLSGHAVGPVLLGRAVY